MSVKVELSVGELLDKLVILEIKSERITDQKKLVNINHEREVLNQLWLEYQPQDLDVSAEIQSLKRINEKLWVIEDDIREKERQKQFDDEFIQLARAVYITNDERSEVKKAINLKSGSDLVEEKSYSDYS